jgi:hypothetical protein
MEESGKGKLFIRAMAGSGGWEDLGRPICQRLDGDLGWMTWYMARPHMVGPVADWTCCSWGRAGALRVRAALHLEAGPIRCVRGLKASLVIGQKAQIGPNPLHLPLYT